jgi:hypothetical protein
MGGPQSLSPISFSLRVYGRGGLVEHVESLVDARAQGEAFQEDVHYLPVVDKVRLVLLDALHNLADVHPLDAIFHAPRPVTVTLARGGTPGLTRFLGGDGLRLGVGRLGGLRRAIFRA